MTLGWLQVSQMGEKLLSHRNPIGAYVSITVEREAVANEGAGRYEVFPVDGDTTIQEAYPPAVRPHRDDDVIQ